MTLPDLFQHRKCIAAQARVEQIESLLEDLESSIDDEIVLDKEWDAYIDPAEKLMEKLAGILNERAKSCIETEITPSQTTKEAPKHDRRIETYLDGFDEFRGECLERYGDEMDGNLSLEAMISLYRGFLTALPDLEKAGDETR